MDDLSFDVGAWHRTSGRSRCMLESQGILWHQEFSSSASQVSAPVITLRKNQPLEQNDHAREANASLEGRGEKEGCLLYSSLILT